MDALEVYALLEWLTGTASQFAGIVIPCGITSIISHLLAPTKLIKTRRLRMMYLDVIGNRD